MSSYNQTKKIMEELSMKVSTSSVQSKKLFVVMLEGTDKEFEELKSLGAVEIENKDILLNFASFFPNITSEDYLNENIKTINRFIQTGGSTNNQYIVADSVITESDVVKLPEETEEIVLKERGIVTPLARDLAKKRGIKIIKS